MYQYHANTMRELHIGRQGENAVRQILFDISDWEAELGPGTAELIYQRSGREDPYPVMVGLDGNTIIWTVTARDTEYPYRNGKCELRYYVTGRDGVAKSRMWTTYVEPSIETPAGDPPETEQGWFDQVISAGADAKAFAESAKIDADRAEAAAIRQPYPDAESGTWWIWDAAAGEYVDSGVSLGQELMEQILASIGNLDDLKTSDKSSLVAAINEIIRSGVSGGVDPADIAKAVEDYMAAHPIQETDPTVPAWAKQPEKPTYTAEEVHALPDTYTPPVVDATLTQPGQAADAAEVGARLSSLSEEIVTTSESKVSAHNTGADTHSDIRLLIQGLTDRLNALADSDDTTLDQLSEVVAYIKSNRALIEAITTDKVSVADIIDNLTTNVANKPLSAAQGVAIKTLIDAINIPEKLPNPNALTFTGAVSGSYDGSEAKTINIPSGGGDIALGITGATVGQIAKITAVDDSGKPTAWEAVDMAIGGGSDGWTEIGEITLEGTEFIISAYSDGIVTISPENGVYPQVNKNTVLRKYDYSSYVNVSFVATGTDGQYTMKNLDGAVYAPSDDLTQYVVDVPSADSISFSNIPEFSFFKAIITTPILSANGLRSTIMSSYDPFSLTDGNSAYISGGAAELVFETEDSPIAGKIYSKGSFKGKSASRANGYDIIRIVDRPTAPANINFFHYNGLLTIGTKVKLWGRN